MKSIKNLMNIGTGDIIGSASSAIFWFYLAILISPSSFGELHYFISVAGILAHCVLIGTHNTITVYVAKKVPIQSTFSFISLIGLIFGFIILFLIFQRIDLGFLAFGYVMSILVMGGFLGKREYKNYMKYVLTQKFLTPILGLSFFFILGVEYILIGLALSYLPYLIVIIKDFRDIKIDFSLLRLRKQFIINNYLMVLSGVVHGQMDKIILMPLLGAMILGNYSLSLQIINVMMIVTHVIYKYMLSQEASGKDIRSVKRLSIFTGIGLTCIGFFIVPSVLPMVFPEYTESVDAIRIMSLSILPLSFVKIYTSKFLSLEKSRVLLIVTIVSTLVFVPTIILFGIWYGVLGIAAAFVLSSIVQVLCFFIADKK